MNANYQTHVFRYRYAGAEWQVAIQATDATDARSRIGALAFATYDGVAVSEQPILSAPFAILWTWVQNLSLRLSRMSGAKP